MLLIDIGMISGKKKTNLTLSNSSLPEVGATLVQFEMLTNHHVRQNERKAFIHKDR